MVNNKLYTGIEERFHNEKYQGKIALPRHYALNPTYSIFVKMKEMLGEISGKRILEYGCGEGWITAEMASMGGRVDAFDISSEAIENATQFLRKNNLLDKCNLKQMAAEQLNYNDETYDLVVGFAILHHLDLSKAVPELVRVMKKGGRAYFAEPLGENPVVNLYRYLTPQYRTPTEKPIVFKEFNKFLVNFVSYKHTEYFFLTLLPIALANFSVRLASILMPYFIKLDAVILKKAPFIRRYAWYSLIELTK